MFLFFGVKFCPQKSLTQLLIGQLRPKISASHLVWSHIGVG